MKGCWLTWTNWLVNNEWRRTNWTRPMADQKDQWRTISDAARDLGVTENAVRIRVRKGRLLATRDNRGRILVSTGSVGPSSSGLVRPDQPDPSEILSPNKTGATLVPLSFCTERLQEQQARHDEVVSRFLSDAATQQQRFDAEISRLRSDMNAERQRHEAELGRMERAYQKATDSLMARVAGILVSNRPRPWWVSLFGESKRSQIRQ